MSVVRGPPDLARGVARLAATGHVTSAAPRGGRSAAVDAVTRSLRARIGSRRRASRAKPRFTDLLARVRRAIFFPDNQVGWLPFGFVAALRAHRTQPVDAVFSTFPPMTSHLIAGLVPTRTGVHGSPNSAILGSATPSRPIVRRGSYRQLSARWSAWVVRSADEMICVTPTLGRDVPGAIRRLT